MKDTGVKKDTPANAEEEDKTFDMYHVKSRLNLILLLLFILIMLVLFLYAFIFGSSPEV